VEGPAVSFRPSNMAHPNKSHRPPLCHPERTRISYFTALPAATYVALRKESRMKSTEDTVFDRKSGAAEGSAVRPGSRSKVWVLLVLTQTLKPQWFVLLRRSPLNRGEGALHPRIVTAGHRLFDLRVHLPADQYGSVADIEP